MIRSSVFANWHLLKLVPTLLQRWGDRGSIFLDNAISKGWLPGSMRKIFLGCKTGMRPRYLSAFQRNVEEKNVQLSIF